MIQEPRWQNKVWIHLNNQRNIANVKQRGQILRNRRGQNNDRGAPRD